MTSLVPRNANRHQSLFPTWELWVNVSVSAQMFNGFGLTEVDTDTCTWNLDREWTVTCTWNDMWRCWYREMLISTNHCLRFENFQLKVSVSAQLFNGFGLTEADRQLAPQNGTDNWTVTCTWDDMWRSQYSRMLISTNHCLRFANFELTGTCRLICSMVLDWPRRTDNLHLRMGPTSRLSLALEIILIGT